MELEGMSSSVFLIDKKCKISYNNYILCDLNKKYIIIFETN